MKYLALALSACIVAACSQPEAPAAAAATEPTQADIALADSAVPKDDELAAIYERSCRSCHSVHGLGAPLTAHKADWKARLETRGAAGLLESTKNGLNTMPAMGLCNDCSDADFEALIAFMSGEV